MKTVISAAVAAIFILSGSVSADETKPIELSTAQLDQVTAGTGANNAGVRGWQVGGPGRGLKENFVVAHLPQSENGLPNASGDKPAISMFIDGVCDDCIGGVAVPSVVPGSVPF